MLGWNACNLAEWRRMKSATPSVLVTRRRDRTMAATRTSTRDAPPAQDDINGVSTMYPLA